MYLDSAIIVKLLVREDDSEFFNASLAGHPLTTSELGLVEIRSALFIKERTGAIGRRECASALQRLDRLIQNEELRLLPLDTRTVERAAVILEACHPTIALRSLDALHVASCDLYRCETLCATDSRMRSAGARFAIKLFPPSEDKAET